MRDNWELSLRTSRVVLLPYRRHHVLQYHEWMKSPDLLEATASEPLSLDEEYAMQKSWRDDPKKCTFIIHVESADDDGGGGGGGGGDGISAPLLHMIGDTNLFFNDPEDPLPVEIEIMIAEPNYRRKGLATESLKMMMAYAVQNLNVQRFVAKIGYDNSSSLAMFTSSSLGYTVFERHDWCEETHCALDLRDNSHKSIKKKINTWYQEIVVQRNMPSKEEEYDLPQHAWSERWFYGMLQQYLSPSELFNVGITNAALFGLHSLRRPSTTNAAIIIMEDEFTNPVATKVGSSKSDVGVGVGAGKDCDSDNSDNSNDSDDSDEPVPNPNFSGMVLFDTDSMWYIDLPGGELTFHNIPIFCINNKKGNNDKNDTGHITWDGAIVMAKWLERHPAICGGKRILELGAGTGFVGLSTIPCGSSYVW